MLYEAVKSYLSKAEGRPFFYAVGDENYLQVLDELKQNGVVVDRISDFCRKEDRFPSMDEVIDHFRTLDVDHRQNQHVLIGLGEYLALKGADAARKTLQRLESSTLGTARVILLLRCVTTQVYELSADDARIKAQNRLYVERPAVSSIEVVRTQYAAGEEAACGVKGLLRRLEDGASGEVHVKSALDFTGAMLTVASIETALDAIQQRLPEEKLEETLGTKAQWETLWKVLAKQSFSLENVFAHYQCRQDFDEQFYEKCSGTEFENWVFFLFLKQRGKTLQNGYLIEVLSQTTRLEDLKENLLMGILRIQRDDPRFPRFYAERKKLLKGFPEAEMAGFVRENQVNAAESIYRLTDNTTVEREEILSWVAQHGWVEEIREIYPALAQYLSEYALDCGSLSEKLTRYFRQYRWQKVLNHIEPDFLAQVEQNAEALSYTHLETRDSAILKIADKKSAFLYWIDALGVEYLPYMAALAQKKGLSLHADITYVELPTITSINRGFYEKWPEDRKRKEPHLDEIKHKAEGGYFYQPGQAPIHLASELEVIKKAIDWAATELAAHHCKTFVIASDHGASRLAVLHHQEEKYETDTRGEHSGRCCKEFPGADLPQAVRENGYLVLTDYGRFRNSRAANVEVHGGASLEEVVVPVVTLTLKKQVERTVRLLDAEKIRADRRLGTTIQLYISDVEEPQKVCIVVGEKRYPAKALDATHYEGQLGDYRRAKKDVSAEVYEGDDLIGAFHFEIKGKMAAIDHDFEELL